MADLSPNRTRIVPIMAGRKATTKSSNNNLNETAQKPTRSARKTRNSNKQASEAELLKIACLEPLNLYALPTKGDGMSSLLFRYPRLLSLFLWHMPMSYYSSGDLKTPCFTTQ
jgi:hypothetical protein